MPPSLNAGVHPVYPSRPRRAVPDLAPAEPDQAAPTAPPRQPRVMVRFTDRSWALCRVLGWQRRGDGWIIGLAWGDFGVMREGWFAHDPERVAEVSG